MSVFVLVEENVFDSRPGELTSDSPGQDRNTRSDLAIRRPMRGIVIRPDTYSTIRVRRADGVLLEMKNSSSLNERPTMTANYLIQEMRQARAEKFQISETFGNVDYGFFFGQKPVVYSFRGVLLDTADFNWAAEWWHNYENLFRGTRLVERNAVVEITVGNKVLSGYILNSDMSDTTAEPYHTAVTFTMWVTGYVELSDVGSQEFPGATYVDPETGTAIQQKDQKDNNKPGFISQNRDEYLLRDAVEKGGKETEATDVPKRSQEELGQALLDRLGDLVDTDSFSAEDWIAMASNGAEGAQRVFGAYRGGGSFGGTGWAGVGSL